MGKSKQEIAIAKANLAAKEIEIIKRRNLVQDENFEEKQNEEKILFDEIEDGNDLPIFSNVLKEEFALHDAGVDVDRSVEAEIEEEELKDLTLVEGDHLMAICKTTEGEDLSYLEVLIYEEFESNSYVHHDIMLPGIPLCIEAIECNLVPKEPHVYSYVAIGTFEPDIEIWDVNLIGACYPAIILQGCNDKIYGHKKKHPQPQKGDFYTGHTGPVICLAWYPKYPNWLLSGGADGLVFIWNLGTKKPIQIFKHHAESNAKVQFVQWHPTHPQGLFITAGLDDRTVYVCSTITDKAEILCKLGGDPECARWSSTDEPLLAISDEFGTVYLFEGIAKTAAQPIFQRTVSFKAHTRSCTQLDWHPLVPNLLLTASTDQQVKVWLISSSPALNFKCLIQKSFPRVGKILSTRFCPDSPWLILVAGSRGNLAIWDLRSTHLTTSDNFSSDNSSNDENIEDHGIDMSVESNDNDNLINLISKYCKHIDQ